MVNRVNAYDQQRFDPRSTVVKFSKDGTRYMEETARFRPCTLVEHLNTNHHGSPSSDSRSISPFSKLFRSMEFSLKSRRQPKYHSMVEKVVPQKAIEVHLHSIPQEISTEKVGLLNDSIFAEDHINATSKNFDNFGGQKSSMNVKEIQEVQDERNLFAHLRSRMHIFSCLGSSAFREHVPKNYPREKDMTVAPPPVRQFRIWIPGVCTKPATV